MPGDTNREDDVFVRDRLAGVTERVSVAWNSRQGNDLSFDPAISANGRYVAFTSLASNLVPGDTNKVVDVFVHDRVTGATRRVSIGPAGQGNSWSGEPRISADGRVVAFTSGASNLVAGDTNRADDVFIRDRLAGVTRRVSVGTVGQSNHNSGLSAISADGRFVAFDSFASNLVPRDRNHAKDVFVRDLQAGLTRRVSVGGDGQGNSWSEFPAISAHGRFVAFASAASNLVPRDTNRTVDIFVRDRQAGLTRRVSVGAAGQSNRWSEFPAISANGRVIAFTSKASNLVPGDTNRADDVFIRDRLAGSTRRVSVGFRGQANGDSVFPAITADGRSVAFISAATNLVPGDTNNKPDTFVRDPLLGSPRQAPPGAATTGLPR